MSEPTRKPPARPLTAVDTVVNRVTSVTSAGIGGPGDDRVLCDRCGAEMYRMHAVWRCQGCGYKTDCCGW